MSSITRKIDEEEDEKDLGYEMDDDLAVVLTPTDFELKSGSYPLPRGFPLYLHLSQEKRRGRGRLYYLSSDHLDANGRPSSPPSVYRLADGKVFIADHRDDEMYYLLLNGEVLRGTRSLTPKDTVRVMVRGVAAADASITLAVVAGSRKKSSQEETPSLYCHPIESDHLSTDELAVLNIAKAELYRKIPSLTSDERVSLERQAGSIQHGEDEPDWITVYALMRVSETNRDVCAGVAEDRNHGPVETAVAYARFVEMERELVILSKRKLLGETALPQNKWSSPLVPDSGAMDGAPGMKFDQGKLDWSLLPWVAVAEVVKVMEYGAKKYARDNWQKVLEAKRRYFSATIRHLLARMNGERTDEESGLLHLAHAACCVLFLLALDVWGRLEDQNADTDVRS